MKAAAIPSSAPPRARAAVEGALDRIEADGRSGIWIEVIDADEALAVAAAVDRRREAGEPLPLAGTTLAVKGNIDVVGHRNTAGCPSFGEVAGRSARSVEALEAAGAVVVGITNLDQFATGLVGTRSPYGACPNARWSELVSGGSSSGSAVAVASGLVDLALGTDTAGSGRVPAAANGIIGLKPTRGRWSTLGIVPACRSLDCASVFARSLPLATEAAQVLSDQPPDPIDVWRRSGEQASMPAGAIRIGVPTAGSLTFAGDE
ncbi:MAG: amidase family protein, partial [Acidimicrobiales bacterium]